MSTAKAIPINKYYSLLKLIRSKNLLIVLAAHYFTAFFLVKGISPWQVLTDINIHLLAIAAFFTAAAGYIINDYFDLKIDFINKPKEVIIGRYISRRWALFWHYMFCSIALFASYIVTYKVTALVFLIQFVLWLYALKLKRIALVGNVAIALLTAMVIGMVALYYHYYSNNLIVFMLFAFTSNLIREIIKDMEDVKGDKASGCVTLPIWVGMLNSKIVVSVFIVILVGELAYYAYLLHSWKSAFLTLGFALFMLVFAVKLIRADTKEHYHELSSWAKWLMLGGMMLMVI